MEFFVIGVLTLIVVVGSATVTWAVQRFNLPASTVAIAFTLTAISWLALLVAAIGITIRTIALA